MPPNIKLNFNLPAGDELIAVPQSGGSQIPPPPPLTLDHNHQNTNDDDDDFFLHDIEENIVETTNPPSPPPPNPSSETNYNISDYHNQQQLNNEVDQDLEKNNGTSHEHDEHQLHHLHDEHEHNHHLHHHHARRVIRHLASQVSDVDEFGIDEKRLSRAVRDAGEYAYGVIACEVWMLSSDDDNKLIRPRGGWWHNNKLYYPQNNSIIMATALDDLASNDPEPMMPGVDLPGILWAESHHGTTLRPSHSSFFGGIRPAGHGSNNRSTDSLPHQLQQQQQASGAASNCPAIKPSGSGTGFFRSTRSPVQSIEDLVSHLHLHTSISTSGTVTTTNPHALVWRDLHSIEQDPDSAKTARLGQLIDAGLCAAAGVPFHVNHHRGLVIYFARSHKKRSAATTSTHHHHHLLSSNVANDAYLRASAEMIGHAASLSEMRRASVEAKRRLNKQSIERFKRNMIDQQDTLSLDDLPTEQSRLDKTFHSVRTWWNKCHGGNLQVPPSLSVRQTLWTILGAFCGLLVLSSLNEYYKMLSDEDYFLLIGPFGALMTLQYGLTSAPASQPRNAILGQAVSGAVSLAFTYIPESILATWLRRAVGPAVAIGAMVKLGVTHPPAGAHAVLYASGQYNFGFYALVVLSSAISVIPATVVNNLSSKRQYPTYWTMIQLPDFLSEVKNKNSE